MADFIVTKVHIGWELRSNLSRSTRWMKQHIYNVTIKADGYVYAQLRRFNEGNY